ncbi:DUF86 domain-containing protein [Patescibacteria group bacterium]
MKKDLNIFIEHILESITEIEKYTKNISCAKFLKTTQIQDAVIRRLEIIGEAVKNLPLSLKKQSPYIPWQKIAGLRDVLIHEYFGVDIDLVWKIIKKDLPKFKKEIIELTKLI